MSEPAIDRIATELKSEENGLDATLASLEQQASATRDHLKRVRQALVALTGKRSAGASKHDRPPQKPAPSRADVLAVIEQILATKSPVPEDTLKKQATSAITAHGKSRMGLSLRLSEALQDPRFVRTESGFRLASPPSTRSQVSP